jgi:hypothetical protein
MTQTKYKRRTFKDVEAEGYLRGWKECREKFEDANIELGRTILALQTKLDNVSLRKLAWSRITGLFGVGRDRVA